MNVLKFFSAFLLGLLSTILTTCIGVIFVPFIIVFLIYGYTSVIYNALTEQENTKTPTIKDVFKEAVEKISQSKKSEE